MVVKERNQGLGAVLFAIDVRLELREERELSGGSGGILARAGRDVSPGVRSHSPPTQGPGFNKHREKLTAGARAYHCHCRVNFLAPLRRLPTCALSRPSFHADPSRIPLACCFSAAAGNAPACNSRLRNTNTRPAAKLVTTSNTANSDTTTHSARRAACRLAKPLYPSPHPAISPLPRSLLITPPGLSWHQAGALSSPAPDAGLGGASPAAAQPCGDAPSTNSISPPFANTSSHVTHALSHSSPFTFKLCT